jgi:hypothetical protein
MALSKNTKFWFSRIMVMVAVMACSLAFLMYVPEPGSSTSAKGRDGGSKSLAESVSNFYAEFRHTSRDPIREQFGDYTIILEDNNDMAVGSAIDQVTENNYEPMDNWEGDFKERAFAAESTLMKEATAHIAKEGFNLVWDLNQDFVIRNRYRSTATLVGMLEDIAGAVDSNFNQPILVYYCFKKRALVITVRESTYLNVNCQKTVENFQSY